MKKLNGNGLRLIFFLLLGVLFVVIGADIHVAQAADKKPVKRKDH